MLLSKCSLGTWSEIVDVTERAVQSLSHAVTVLCCETQMHQELVYPLCGLKPQIRHD